MAGLLPASELASIGLTVASALDTPVPVYRKTVTADGYGHNTETWSTFVGLFNVNTSKPTSTQLQAYGHIIGTRESMILRYLSSEDIREGDRVAFAGKNWLVQYLLPVESYSIPHDALMTVIE